MTMNANIKIEEVTAVVYRFTCPYCKKVYQSLYAGQLVGIATLHLAKHMKGAKK